MYKYRATLEIVGNVIFLCHPSFISSELFALKKMCECLCQNSMLLTSSTLFLDRRLNSTQGEIRVGPSHQVKLLHQSSVSYSSAGPLFC